MKKLVAGLGVFLLALSIYNSIFPITYFRTYFNGSSVEKQKSDDGKTDSPDEYFKYYEEITTMIGQESSGYPFGYRLREYEKSKRQLLQLRAKKLKSFEWTERGPANVPGRTRGLIIHPQDPLGKTWIAGSAGGGIWKTTDGGISWTNKTPDLPNLATATIALSPADPSIIYAGTGEGGFSFFNSITGDGIFKSTDGGETWQQLASTADNVNFQNVNRIIVHPEDPDVVLACSFGFPPFASGILKSTDGGITWDGVHQASARVQQLIADPTNFNIIFATVNRQGILKSIDQGETWKGIGLLTTGRIELAIAPTNPERLYASVEGDLQNVGSDLFISDDGGETWNVMGTESGIRPPGWLGNQGFYDNAIAVHPFDEDVVYVGGIDFYKAEVKPGTRAKSARLIGVTEVDTQSFMDFINSGNSQLRGGLGTGLEWYADHDGYPTDFDAADFTTVEIRFGPGKKQMAHRFIVPLTGGTNMDGGAGVIPVDHLYQDYVEVPFEVWDTDEDRQIMVSFRDQERDGTWNLIEFDREEEIDGRDYIFIHPMDYDPVDPHPEVAKNGGQAYRTIYCMWPTLPEDGVFDPDNLPESKLVIKYGQLIERLMIPTQITSSAGAFVESVTVVHPDIHNIQTFSSAEGTFNFVIATDGGIYKTKEEDFPGEDNGDWQHSAFGYNTTQFYGVDKAPKISKYIGGTQDNGSWVSINTNPDDKGLYVQIIGGDGFDAFWSYQEPNLVIGSVFNNIFRRSVDGGVTWADATGGLGDNDEETAPFFSTIAGHKAKGKILYTVGVTGVWKTSNFAESWSSIPINSKWIFEDIITSSQTVVVSEANPSIVWAGGGMTADINLHVSTDGGSSFSIVNNVADTLGGISRIATHPTEPNTAYVLFSFAQYGKIFRTEDLGETWTDISGFNGGEESTTGFPDITVYSMLVLPHEPKTLWVGTEVGIYESTDNGSSWHLLPGNFPATAVWKLLAVDDQVIAATHGRGIWSVTIPELDWPGEVITNVEDPSLTHGITVFPNPVDRNISINYEFAQPGAASLRIIQSDGKVLLQKEYNLFKTKGILSLDAGNLPEGILILSITKGEKHFSTRVMVDH